MKLLTSRKFIPSICKNKFNSFEVLEIRALLSTFPGAIDPGELISDNSTISLAVCSLTPDDTDIEIFGENNTRVTEVDSLVLHLDAVPQIKLTESPTASSTPTPEPILSPAESTWLDSAFTIFHNSISAIVPRLNNGDATNSKNIGRHLTKIAYNFDGTPRADLFGASVDLLVQVSGFIKNWAISSQAQLKLDAPELSEIEKLWYTKQSENSYWERARKIGYVAEAGLSILSPIAKLFPYIPLSGLSANGKPANFQEFHLHYITPTTQVIFFTLLAESIWTTWSNAQHESHIHDLFIKNVISTPEANREVIAALNLIADSQQPSATYFGMMNPLTKIVGITTGLLLSGSRLKMLPIIGEFDKPGASFEKSHSSNHPFAKLRSTTHKLQGIQSGSIMGGSAFHFLHKYFKGTLPYDSVTIEASIHVLLTALRDEYHAAFKHHKHMYDSEAIEATKPCDSFDASKLYGHITDLLTEVGGPYLTSKALFILAKTDPTDPISQLYLKTALRL